MVTPLATPQEVAERLRISPHTVTLWIREGRLPAHRIPGTRRWLIDWADVDRLLGKAAS